VRAENIVVAGCRIGYACVVLGAPLMQVREFYWLS
jgi:hypothetical protein